MSGQPLHGEMQPGVTAPRRGMPFRPAPGGHPEIIHFIMQSFAAEHTGGRIASRFIKGLSAAVTAPAGLSIITTTFPEGPLRNRALSIYTTCAAAGVSTGLVLSGLLTEASWRLTMLPPAPIALIALAAGLKLLPRSDREKDHNGYDVPGAVLGTASMLLLVFTVVQAPEVGWASTRRLLSFLVVAALLTVFVLVERRSAGPLIRLGMLRSGSQIRARLGAMAFFGSYSASSS